MSFRKRQDFRLSICSPVYQLESVTLETGEVENRCEDMTSVQLPEPALFDLEDNLKAGVNLKESSSKILGSSRVALEDVVDISEKHNESPDDVQDNDKE